MEENLLFRAFGRTFLRAVLLVQRVEVVHPLRVLRGDTEGLVSVFQRRAVDRETGIPSAGLCRGTNRQTGPCRPTTDFGERSVVLIEETHAVRCERRRGYRRAGAGSARLRVLAVLRLLPCFRLLS